MENPEGMPALISVQYLEDGPGVRAIPPAAARSKLRAAAEHLPISMVRVGWNLPPALRDACGEEARRTGARFDRWHPLRTGDGVLAPRREWPAVLEGIGMRLSAALDGGIYDGFCSTRFAR